MRKSLKSSISIVLTVLLIMLLFTGCTSHIKKYTLSENVITSEKDYSAFSGKFKLSNNNLADSDGNLNLYYDSKTCSVALKNNSSGKVWYSLPEKVNKSAKINPSVLTVDVLYDGQQYELNSQLDCVKNNGATKEKDDDGIIIKYRFSFTPEGKQTVNIIVPVHFYLAEGNFYCCAMCGNISVSDKEAVITKIYLMNFFASSTENQNSDFYLLPDNCGSAYYPTKNGKNKTNRSLKVYGDLDTNNCLLGAFGAKIGNDAFVAIIEQGDSIANINLQVKEKTGYNTIGTCFDLTQTQTQTNSKNSKTSVFISADSYSGNAEICYRFLSGNNADYSGMAIACREKLIRNGVISAQSADDSESLPFVLSAIGMDNTSSKKNVVLTSYEQLQDMLTYMKGKGFSNIYINYKGTLSGGNDQNNITRATLSDALGNDEQYKELTDYITAQQMKLFFSIRTISCSSGNIGSGRLAYDTQSTLITKETLNSFGSVSKFNYCNKNEISQNVISLFAFSDDNGISNINLSDVATGLYCDSSTNSNRDDIMKEIHDETVATNNIGTIMVEKGNFYAIKNIAMINSMPLSVENASSAYVSVPFIPLILHGTVAYSSEPINYAEDYQTAMLRAVEYGAMPQFEWCYEKTSSDTQSTDIHDYSQWATIAYTFYEKANKALGDLQSRRITSHYKVKNGVYATQYDDTTVYVNYTAKNVKIHGVTIPAKDFMRIN